MRVRLRLRHAMVLVAVVAIGLFAWEEFRDGFPPRFVVRGIPARIARVKPGMSYQQTMDILGLETSWLQGGSDAWKYYGSGNERLIVWVYNVGPEPTPTPTSPGKSKPKGWLFARRPILQIQVQFDLDQDNPSRNWRQLKTTRLAWARFVADDKIIAETPRRR